MNPNPFGNRPLEVAHLIFRIASPVKHKDLKSKIEFCGINLLESITVGDLDTAARASELLEKFIVLGESIGEIHMRHANTVYGELNSIKSAIRQEKDKHIAELDRNRFRFGDAYSTSKNIEVENDKNENELRPAFPQAASDERQTLITDKIRQFGNAAMKDLIIALPNVSERTIRYDLQKLCEHGTIERFGNGGPSSHYRLKSDKLAARDGGESAPFNMTEISREA